MNGSLAFPVVILPLFALIAIFTRLLTTLIHELGHAIPALIFTKNDVDVFLGFYGDYDKSKCLKLSRRFRIYFTLNPLRWWGGMVSYSALSDSFYKRLSVLLLGPLFSIILAIAAIFAVWCFDLNGFLKLLTMFFLVSAIIDLRNLYPNSTPIKTFSGSTTYNDGTLIKRLINDKDNVKRLSSAYKLYAEGDYWGAIDLFQRLNLNFVTLDALSIITSSYIQVKQFRAAKTFYSRLINSPIWQGLDSANFFNIGLVESRLNEAATALTYYNKSLELDSNNVYSLSNRGYTYILFEDYVAAIADFDKVIKNDPESAYVYANRGYAKLKLGLVDYSLIDIKRAINIDDTNAYAHRNLGLYYLETGNYGQALEKLKIAYNLDPDTHLIKDFIAIVEQKLANITVDKIK